MNANIKHKLRLVIDWSAVFWAGLISGIIFYILNIFLLPALLGGNMWIFVRLFASIILGENILAPPATFDVSAMITSIIINFFLSTGFSILVAFVFHKWGIWTGIIGGSLFGIGIYLINFYTLSYFFPWFFALSSWPFVLNHIILGAAAGGIYELLEVEEYELVSEN